MAGLTVKHVFQSAKGDGVDPSLVQPSNWNASHDLEMDTGNILGRHTAGAGVVEQLTPTVVAAMLLTAIQAALSLGALATKNAVGSADITDGSVANVDLANMTAPAFKGRATTGTGAPEDLTVAQAMALLTTFVADTGVAVGVRGLVPASGIGDAAARKFLMATGAWAAPSLAPDIIVEDQKANNTSPQSFAGGAYHTRDLNTKVRDALAIASVSSNQLTISAAGTYYIEFATPDLGNNGAMKCRLRDVTNNATVGVGMNGGNGNGTNFASNSEGSCVVTIAGATVYELQGWHSSNVATAGTSTNSGEVEVYSRLMVWKIA